MRLVIIAEVCALGLALVALFGWDARWLVLIFLNWDGLRDSLSVAHLQLVDCLEMVTLVLLAAIDIIYWGL